MNQTQSENKSDSLYRKIARCRSCNSRHILPVIDLGYQPNANSLLKADTEKKVNENLSIKQIQSEVKIPLAMCFCERCKSFQQLYTVSREYLFKDYVYFSSTSPVFVTHFTDFANKLLELNPQLVVDIGSNDGIFLRALANPGMPKAVGIEPAENVAKVANEAGLKTEVGWIDDKFFVEKFIKQYGKADVIVACNVFAHVNNIKTFLSNVKRMLTNDGVFIVEVAHLLKFVENNYFDTIYHEHFFIHSVIALSNLFHYSGMKIVKVEEIDTHGGSIRLYVKKNKARHAVDSSVKEMIVKELKSGLQYASTFVQMNDRIKENGHLLRTIIFDIIDNKKQKIAGYGAPAKANTLLNTFQITNDHILCIADDAPAKQGLFTPESRISIVDTQTMLNKVKPDYILILAWNFKDSIMRKLKEAGYTGKFIIPCPVPVVLEN